MSTPVPEKLYKYVTFDRLDVLKDGCIRFTQPAALNDLREMNPYVETMMSKETFDLQIAKPLLDDLAMEEGVLRLAIEGWEKMSPSERAARPGGLPAYKRQTRRNYQNNPEHFAQLYENTRQKTEKVFEDYNPLDGQLAIETFRKFSGVLSLTANFGNEAMWAHYAAENAGLVIEFDTSHPFFNRRLSVDKVARPLQVIYTDQLPAFQSFEEIMKLGSAKAMEALACTKKSHWSYEEEWRLICPLHSADKKFDVKPHAIHLFELPADAITGVIVGANMPTENREIIRDILAGDNRYEHVAFSEAIISNRSSDVEIRHLN